MDFGGRRNRTGAGSGNTGPSALDRVLEFLRKRRVSLLALGMALVAGIALASGNMETVVRSVYLVDGLLQYDHQPRFLGMVGHPVSRVRHRAPSPGGGSVALDIYRPEGAGPWPALLLMPGFDRLGLEDPYIVGLARLLAGLGLVVSVPDLRELFEYRWTPAVGDEIEAAFDYMANLPEVRADRLGLFGLSISGGLGLGAATRPAIASRLSYGIAFAPFHDFARMFRFIATGCPRNEDTECTGKPSEFSRRVFLYNYLHVILPPSDQDYSTIREIIRLQLHQRQEAVPGLVARLSPAGRDMLGRLEAGDQAMLEQVLEPAIAEFRKSAEQISPHVNLCNLRGALFIIHGRQDNVIPYSESVSLFDHCQKCGGLACNLLTTDIYGHVDNRGGLIRHFLDHLRFFVFVHRITRTMLSS